MGIHYREFKPTGRLNLTLETTGHPRIYQGSTSVTSVNRLLSRERSLSSSEKEPKLSPRRKFKEKSLSSSSYEQEDSTSRDSYRTNFFQENQPQATLTTMYNDRKSTNSNHAIDADRFCLSPSVSRGRGLPGRVPDGAAQHDDGPGNGSTCHRKQFLQGL